MGTDWSTNAPNDASNQQTQSDYKEDAKETESKIHDEIQKQMEEENKEFQQKLDKVEESIKKDNSVPNLVSNFAELRTMIPPNVHTLGDFVEKMKDGWEGIMSQLDAIREYGDEGRKKAEIMEEIHLDYWRLLLKTRSKIQLIMTRCKIQKRNITQLLSILKDAHDPKKAFTADDKLAYQDCINCLSMWLRSDNVQNIIQEWKKMTERLLKEKQDWQSFAKVIGKSIWNDVMSYFQWIASCACVAIAVVALVGLVIVVTDGTAVGAMIDPVVRSLSTTITEALDDENLRQTAIAAAVCFGESVVNSVIQMRRYFGQTVELHNTAVKMQDRLEVLLKQSVKMEEKLKAVDDACLNATEQVEFMKDVKSRKIMESALNDLVEYLDEYMKQGKKVMQTIQESAEKFINV